MMEYYKKINACRLCYSNDIVPVLKFKEQYIGTVFVKDNATHPMAKIKVPLTLMFCKDCGLVQLEEVVNPDLLYRDYYYRTAVNDTMRKDLKELVDSAIEKVLLNNRDYVLDIGANDCTMISMFPSNVIKIAVEPALNIDWIDVDDSIFIINDYFSYESVKKFLWENKVKIITSTAMFYDLDDPHKALQDIKKLLMPDGICVIQVSYLLATIRDMNVYDIVHEHLNYYSLETLDLLMDKNDLFIFDVSTNSVNGGSLRIYVTHKDTNRKRTERFYEVLEEEKKYKLKDIDTYFDYNDKVNRLIEVSKDFILSEIKNGGFVIGLGASTKGNVLLQICDIDFSILPYISERSELKIGLYTLGTNIKLISEEEARKMNPSMMVVLPWSFKDEIIEREKEYIKNGGKLFFIMPYPHFIDKNGECRLVF